MIFVHTKTMVLGYHYKSKSFSLIDNLYESNQIDKKQFSFYNINKANPLSEMHIYFGGVPNNKTYKYKGVIKVDESLPTWGSMFNFIIYNSKEYKFNLPCMISSSTLTIVSSDEIYNFFVELFKEKISREECKESIFLPPNRKMFLCNNIPNEKIDFVFGNVTFFKFTMEDLLRQEQLLISSSGKEKIHNPNGAVLGMLFLSKFNISLFDFDNKQIEFHSDLYQITISSKDLTIYVSNISMIITLLCIVNSLYLIGNDWRLRTKVN